MSLAAVCHFTDPPSHQQQNRQQAGIGQNQERNICNSNLSILSSAGIALSHCTSRPEFIPRMAANNSSEYHSKEDQEVIGNQSAADYCKNRLNWLHNAQQLHTPTSNTTVLKSSLSLCSDLSRYAYSMLNGSTSSQQRMQSTQQANHLPFGESRHGTGGPDFVQKAHQLRQNVEHLIGTERFRDSSASTVKISSPTFEHAMVCNNSELSAIRSRRPQQIKTSLKRRVRAPIVSNYRCHSCGITETPEWRRGPDGPRTLCNACGLYYAKLLKRTKAKPTATTATLSDPNTNIPTNTNSITIERKAQTNRVTVNSLLNSSP